MGLTFNMNEDGTINVGFDFSDLIHPIGNDKPRQLFSDESLSKARNSKTLTKEKYANASFGAVILAAVKGDGEAMDVVGCSYHTGEDVEENKCEAAMWFKQSAAKHFGWGEYHLGCYYEMGCGGVEQNIQEAFNWYIKAAEQGVPDAQNNVGSILARGDLGTADYEGAAKWYRIAAKRGNKDAIENLKALEDEGVISAKAVKPVKTKVNGSKILAILDKNNPTEEAYKEIKEKLGYEIKVDAKSKVHLVRYRGNSTNLTLDSGIEVIDNCAFISTKVKHLHIPDSVTSLKKDSFQCSAISDVELSKSITKIPKDLFATNKKIQSITIPSNVKTIEAHALSFCSIKKIIVEEGVKCIKTDAIVNNYNLKELTIMGADTILEDKSVTNFKDTSNDKAPTVVKCRKGSKAEKYFREYFEKTKSNELLEKDKDYNSQLKKNAEIVEKFSKNYDIKTFEDVIACKYCPFIIEYI